MIIPTEFAQAYARLRPRLEELKAKVDPLISGAAYQAEGRAIPCRIKPEDSLLLKTEKDRLLNAFLEADDLLAATIVVPNEKQVEVAASALESQFDIKERKANKTRRPEEFIYDDLHLILTLKLAAGELPSKLHRIKFEVQIKTEMQAAVSVVTRKLSYKPHVLSWTRARMASRIRALVETVDDLLTRIGEEDPAEDARTGTFRTFTERNAITQGLEEIFAQDDFPEDRRRLAQIVETLLRESRPSLRIEDLKTILRRPAHAQIISATSISIVEKILIVLFREERLGPATDLHGDNRFLITSEMVDLCPPLRDVPPERRVSLAVDDIL